MLFNVALFTGSLLVPGALAVPSGLAAQLARRQSQNCRSGNTNTTLYSPNWAGAILTQDNGIFQVVSGTFTVPTLSTSSQASVGLAAWVGIDGAVCNSSLLQTGVSLTVDNGQVDYAAIYQWLPDSPNVFSDMVISAGDVIQLTVVATTPTTGVVQIYNLSSGQLVSKYLTSTFPLCQQNAEWIVEDYSLNSGLVPFANFGNITFTNAGADGTAFHSPAEAQIVEIVQNNIFLTSVSTCESSVTITHL